LGEKIVGTGPGRGPCRRRDGRAGLPGRRQN
jgi:hypothetical protein